MTTRGCLWKSQKGGPAWLEDTFIMALLSPFPPPSVRETGNAEGGNLSHIIWMGGGFCPHHPSIHLQFTPVSQQTHESQVYCITALFTVDHVTSLLAVLVWRVSACQLFFHVYSIDTSSSGINLITSSLQNHINMIEQSNLTNNDSVLWTKLKNLFI